MEQILQAMNLTNWFQALLELQRGEQVLQRLKIIEQEI
jgi:hypothetical protein